MSGVKVKVVGAGGYGGVGIVELLLQHPEAEIACLVAKDNAGTRMSELYPHLRGQKKSDATMRRGHRAARDG